MRATNLAGVTAILTLDAAVMVIVFGVLVTSGCLRLAAGLAPRRRGAVAGDHHAVELVVDARAPRRAGHATLPAVRTRRLGVSRAVFLTASSLVAIPGALAAALLAADLLVFARHGVSLLR